MLLKLSIKSRSKVWMTVSLKVVKRRRKMERHVERDFSWVRILLCVLDACEEIQVRKGVEYEPVDKYPQSLECNSLGKSLWWTAALSGPRQSELSGKKFSTPSVTQPHTQPITPETTESERANRGGKKKDKCEGNSMKWLNQVGIVNRHEEAIKRRQKSIARALWKYPSVYIV